MQKANKVLILIIIVACTFYLTACHNKKDDNNSSEQEVKSNTITTVSEIELNTSQYINQLEKIKINGTDDTIMITERVKWEVPDYGEDVTVSFAVPIPYTFTIDGNEYNGIYELNDAAWSTPDNNPKYNFVVTNLTQNGDIEVLITNKSQ